MQADSDRNRPISDEIVTKMRAIISQAHPELWTQMTSLMRSVDNLTEDEFKVQFLPLANLIIVLIRNSGLVTSAWDEQKLRLQIQEICWQESKPH